MLGLALHVGMARAQNEPVQPLVKGQVAKQDEAPISR